MPLTDLADRAIGSFSTTLAFAADGGWIVVGSRGGSDRNPDWAHNP